jgi:hypothetical protein
VRSALWRDIDTEQAVRVVGLRGVIDEGDVPRQHSPWSHAQAALASFRDHIHRLLRLPGAPRAPSRRGKPRRPGRPQPRPHARATLAALGNDVDGAGRLIGALRAPARSVARVAGQSKGRDGLSALTAL